jgi:fructosamine-3-kinase
MPSDLAADSVVRGELRALGRADGITSVQRLTGGVIAEAWLVSYADGTQVAGKTVAGAPAEVFQAEAEGLAALRVTGHLPTPQVLAVTTRLLLLEALPPRLPVRDRGAGELERGHRGQVGVRSVPDGAGAARRAGS